MLFLLFNVNMESEHSSLVGFDDGSRGIVVLEEVKRYAGRVVHSLLGIRFSHLVRRRYAS